jgi:hypothetical protein
MDVDLLEGARAELDECSDEGARAHTVCDRARFQRPKLGNLSLEGQDEHRGRA